VAATLIFLIHSSGQIDILQNVQNNKFISYQPQLTQTVTDANKQMQPDILQYLINWNFPVILLMLLFVAAFFAHLLTNIINTQVKRINSEIDHLAKFKITGRTNDTKPSYREFETIFEAVELLTQNFSTQIMSITQQHNELEALFYSMVEVVIAIDNDGRVVTMNKAASELMQIDEKEAKGKFFQEMVKNPDLNRFVRQILMNHQTIEDEILFRKDDDSLTFLQAHGVKITGKDYIKRSGTLIVLNDVTQLKRLENIKKDFVANVSHELKTPITTIKGFVETLRDDAVNDPDEAKRFLNIVLKHADRLNGIVEDLLTLSRIEQEDQNAEISFVEENLLKSLNTSIETCSLKAAEKNIRFIVNCKKSLTIKLNAPLFEQAIVNLIVNAIKYSEDNTVILITAYQNDNCVQVKVQDSGVGIANEHLPRLFERFYRIDKARSRKFGGTGLGLAIVKHIVKAHKGQIVVESALNIGTTFTLSLPGLQTENDLKGECI
jgi:two-component system phosphate regulon sensor histidine kinase PhoR